MKQWEFFTLIAALILSLILPGCAQWSLAPTRINYKAGEGLQYESYKNQENLKASGKIDKNGALTFDVETTATTPEAAMAAAAQAQLRLIELLEKILPLIQKP